MKHRSRKRFGQNFLRDTAVVSQIISAIGANPTDTLVEIGPGEGAITAPLARLAGQLHALELDRDLVPLLQERFAANSTVTIHNVDALSYDFSQLGSQLRVVGNLPYNISTPLMFRLLDYRKHILDMHFMLQKEVVDRMAAQPGNKTYGRLSIMLGCYLSVEPLFDVPPEAFQPAPKVTSSVVRLRPLSRSAHDVQDFGALSRLVGAAFSQRRKTLRNALRQWADPEELERAGMEPGWRPEQAPIESYVKLSKQILNRDSASAAPMG